MPKPIKPINDLERVEILRNLDLLDTPAEERFDGITRIAKSTFDVPAALVTLLDEHRAWIKSCAGLDVDEGPRDVSFCAHAILSSAVLIVNDASTHELFFDNPWVVNPPHIRFYAGCPLTVKGQRIGTLCIIDYKAREFNAEDCAKLKVLAAKVEEEIQATQKVTLDALTKLNNRKGFLEQAEKTFALCNRQEIPVSMVFLDIIDFKTINSSFGASAGDRALIAFSKSLIKTFSEGDVLARWGGGKFAVLTKNATKGQAQTMVETFSKSLHEDIKYANVGFKILFSYGVVQIHLKHTLPASVYLHEAVIASQQSSAIKQS